MEGDIQTCRGFPNIQGASKHKRGIQNVVGVQTYGGIKTYSRCIQTYGASKCMGTYGHPLVSQSMLSLCCVCTGHPNIIKTYRGSSKHMLGVSKQMGCPNIQGAFLHAFLSHKAGFATGALLELQYQNKWHKSLAAKERTKKEGLSIQEAECCLDAELFLDEYLQRDVRGLHCLFIPQRMFVHATESGQKEMERLICCSCQHGLPRLDPRADASAIQLMGY